MGWEEGQGFPLNILLIYSVEESKLYSALGGMSTLPANRGLTPLSQSFPNQLPALEHFHRVIFS